jgi:hypothetical protein
VAHFVRHNSQSCEVCADRKDCAGFKRKGVRIIVRCSFRFISGVAMGDSSSPQSLDPPTDQSVNQSVNPSVNPSPDEALAAIAHLIRTTAQARQGDTLALLALLRTVEALHQEIRDGVFQDSFPDNRQALYNLLRDIETEGGWPHIYRPRLSAFIAQLMADETNDK